LVIYQESCPERVVCVFYVLQAPKCTGTIHSEMP